MKIQIKIFMLVLVTSLPTLAGTQSEVQTFRRCYIQLTGKALAFNDARIAQIQNHSLKAVDACTDIIEKVKINPGNAQGRLISADNESLAVLRNFYRLFTTYINQLSPKRAIPTFFENYSGTEDIQDTTVVGLALTENTFNENRQFRDLFSIQRSPAATRDLDTSVTYPFTMLSHFGAATPNPAQPIYSARSRVGTGGKTSGGVDLNHDNVPYLMDYAGGTATMSFARIPVGELSGISYNSPVQVISLPNGTTTVLGLAINFDMNSTLFKGIFNLRPYILGNTNFIENNSNRPNLEYMPRRLIQNIFQDFMCRDLPVLREADIVQNLSTDPNAIAFRKGTSCLRCHSTMDPAASVYRSVGYTRTQSSSASPQRKSVHVSISPPQSGLAAETGWPAVKDLSFYARPATGRLVFRSVAGNLIDVPLASGNDLGDVLAAQDDPYICHARRLFQYFTGIRVELFDPYDPSNADRMKAMSSKDWEYRNFIFKLGHDLKDLQKGKNVIKDILKSDYYLKTDFNAGSL